MPKFAPEAIRTLALVGHGAAGKPTLAEALGSPLAARRERNWREQVRENLAKLGVSRPRTVKTLSRWMKALLGGQASEEEVAGLVQELQSEGTLQILDGKVSYPKF